MADARWSSVDEFTSEDVWYSRDAEETIDALESLLPDPDDEEGDAPEGAPLGYSVAPDPDSEGLYLWRGPGGEGSDTSFPSRDDAWKDAARAAADDAYSDERALLAALREVREEANSSEWLHGCTFIRESHFTEYAQQLADDVGAVDRNAQWPLNHIDWDAAADSLKYDYSTVEVDGTTFYYRD